MRTYESWSTEELKRELFYYENYWQELVKNTDWDTEKTEESLADAHTALEEALTVAYTAMEEELILRGEK